MTDIHCHILPGFDDGSPSVGESVRMAEMAYASGIRRTVATPHFSALNGDIRRASEEIGRLFASLTEAVDGAGISVKQQLGIFLTEIFGDKSVYLRHMRRAPLASVCIARNNVNKSRFRDAERRRSDVPSESAEHAALVHLYNIAQAETPNDAKLRTAYGYPEKTVRSACTERSINYPALGTGVGNGGGNQWQLPSFRE